MENKQNVTEIYDNEDEFLLAVRKASDKYSKMVAKTAGPKGHNVMLIANNQCHLTKDGISVLRSIIDVDNAADKTAIAVLRGSSEQTNKVAGDGTTATCILANEIFQLGYPYLTAGINGNSLRKGIIKGADLALNFIKKNISTPIKDNADIKKVAKISSNGSDEIADVLAETFEKIGRDGHARVEVSNTTTTSCKIVEGMTFERGMVSPYFATNEHREAVLDNPVVLLVNKKLNVANELVKPFEAMIKMNRPILIIADGYEQDIINTLVVNKLRGLPICAVEAPSWGDWKTGMMEDIAVVVDGRVISPMTGLTLDNVVTPGVLGSAKQVIVTSETTSIISCADMNPETNPRLKERIALLQSEIDDPKKSDHDKGIARTRKARLAGGIGIINVGGNTEAEIHEKKDLVDDAFSSVKSALEDGTVPGGGLTFLCLQSALMSWMTKNAEKLTNDETIGLQVFIEALAKPPMVLIDNAVHGRSKVETQTYMSNIIAFNENAHKEDQTVSAWRIGYDGDTGEITDLVDKGIIDSARAIISAIVNGASAGGSLLTLSGATYTPPPQKPVPVAQPMM